MSKKVLVLTGSPRKGGNSDLMADAFIEGAKSKGHEVTKIEAASQEIRGCVACDACFSTGAACVFNDDFNKLAPKLEETEVIAFVTPIYWYTFPMQIKAVIDKFYSLMVGERPLKIQEVLLLTCGETHEEGDFAGIVKSYEIIADFMKWKDSGRLLVPGVLHKGDIKGTEALQKAKEMGENL